MRYRLYFFLLLMIPVGFVSALSTQQSFDREAYYAIMANGTLVEINEELIIVKGTYVKEKDAFEGALLMRKAGLLKKPEDKLKAFKSGRIKLEMAIMEDKDNIEFRFLRVMIQEHAPHIVKYFKELAEDRKQIINAFPDLFPVVQRAILSYTKSSKILRPEDF